MRKLSRFADRRIPYIGSLSIGESRDFGATEILIFEARSVWYIAIQIIYNMNYSSFDLKKEKRQVQIEKIIDASLVTFTLNARVQGNKVGSISYKKCFLYSLAVEETFRLKGIGTQLFFSAIKDLQEQGCTEVKWNAYSESVPFYQKLGASFVYEGREHIYGLVEMKIDLFSI